MIAINIKSAIAAYCIGGVVCSVALVLGADAARKTQMSTLEISLPFTRIDMII